MASGLLTLIIIGAVLWGLLITIFALGLCRAAAKKTPTPGGDHGN